MTEPKTITSAEMRALEQAAIKSGKVTGLELMERAGQGVVDAIFEEWPETRQPGWRAVVLCGPGNNGGDGFVIARILKAAKLDVAVYFTGELARLSADARANHDRWTEEDGAVFPYETYLLRHHIMQDQPIIIVDALLGIGQSGDCDRMLVPILDVLDDVSNYSISADVHYVSVDVPTGYDTDTGALLSTNPFEPNLTVTFHQRKPVHSEIERDEGCKIVVKDIGI